MSHRRPEKSTGRNRDSGVVSSHHEPYNNRVMWITGGAHREDAASPSPLYGRRVFTSAPISDYVEKLCRGCGEFTALLKAAHDQGNVTSASRACWELRKKTKVWTLSLRHFQ